MRKTLLIGGLTALTLAAVGGVAVAQQAPQRMARAVEPVTQAEFVAKRVDRLTAVDANGDGSVAPEEMRASREARRAERVSAAFDRLDTDNNDSISRAEFETRTVRAEGRARGHRGGRGAERAGRMERGPVAIAEVRARSEQAFARLDANSDGTLSVEEQRVGHQTMREHRRESMGERRAARAAQQSPQAPASE